MSTILKALRRLEEDRDEAPDAKTGVGRRIAATASRGPSGLRIAGIAAAGLALVAVFVWAFGPWREARETAPEPVEARASETTTPASTRVREPAPPVPLRPPEARPSEPPSLAKAPPSPPTMPRAAPAEASPLPAPPAQAAPPFESAPGPESPSFASTRAQAAPSLAPPPAPEAPPLVSPPLVPPPSEPAPPPRVEPSAPKLPPPPTPGTELGSGPPGTRATSSRVASRPPPPPPTAPVRPARASLPEVSIASTTWHPDAVKREAIVRVAGRDGPLRLREGDAVGGLVVQEIEPAAVVFLRGGVEIRKPVGAAR